MKIHAILLTTFILMSFFNAKSQNKTDDDKKIKQQYNWFNLDPQKDHIAGVGTEKAYETLLKGKKSYPIIVAVIDGGVDINHEDLKGKIWVNEKEIPGNGIDDDHNGYVDDINGWNFLGNANGENVNFATMELTREYKKYYAMFFNKELKDVAAKDTADFRKFQNIKEKYDKEKTKAESDYDMIRNFDATFSIADSLIRVYLKKNNYTIDDINAIQTTKDSPVMMVKDYFQQLYKKGFTREDYVSYRDHVYEKYKYQLNLDFDSRKIIGDNPDNPSDSIYGNNDVIGPDPSHGTGVAGIIAANRNNGIGINGIADNVKIMVLRAIPNGDEYDKDVANAIKYAANNGAKIINCSFGKNYSSGKYMVDQAIKLAKAKGVLIIHAAGNDAEDNDMVDHFPTNLDVNRKVIDDNWIDVGASSNKLKKTLTASFSNYGKNTVEVFAPGVDIYTTAPKNTYKIESGTSFSSPVVAGVAALIWSYYPNLTAKDIKQIILQSANVYPKKKVYKPDAQTPEKIKVRFGSLSVTGGVVNVYNALLLAEKWNKK